MPDYKSFKEIAAEIRTGILTELATRHLDEDKRATFYALGAGEGLLLDRINPRWRKGYFAEKFYLDKSFNSAKQQLSKRSPRAHRKSSASQKIKRRPA